MATVFVTGGTGFVGNAVVRQFLAEGHDLKVLARTPRRLDDLPLSQLEIVPGNLDEPSSYARHLAGCDVVVHCAAATGPRRSWDDCVRLNVHGTQHLLDAAVAAQARRFINVSSLSVYGVKPGTYTEDHPLTPTGDAYSDTKIAAENLCTQYHQAGKIAVTTVRPGMVVGPEDSGFLPMCIDMLQKGRFPLFNGGQATIPVVDVQDVAALISTCVAHPDAAGGVYNSAGRESISWKAFATQVAKYYDLVAPRLSIPAGLLYPLGAVMEFLAKIRLAPSPPPLRRFDVSFMANDRVYPMQKAARELGYTPKYSIEETLARALPHYRALAKDGPSSLPRAGSTSRLASRAGRIGRSS